jgi:HK97 gp10 family phage protein
MAGSSASVNVSSVKLDTAVLDKLTREIKPKAAQVVNKYGLLMTGQAAKNAPLDTGALRNSITSESKMTDELEFTISDGVEYGVYQEFGTSRMAAQPFLIPAIEKYAAKFQAAFAELFK